MGIFNRFRKKAQPLEPKPSETAVQNTSATNHEYHDVMNSPFRVEISTLYDNNVDPIQAIMAMMNDRNGTISTDDKRMAAIWLGINDLLDRDDVDRKLRGELVASRNYLAQAMIETNHRLKKFVTDYLADTKRISEMKFLQAYQSKLVDQNGVMQLEAVNAMLADIEHQRDTEPGSRAQDISDEKLARLYNLRDNWGDPSKLK